MQDDPAVEELLEAARRATGLADFGDDAFRAAQRAGARAAAPQHIDAQGYAHEAVLADARIAAYCARHAIAPERERLH